MTVEPPDRADLDAVADLWVDLAADQRAYGSHVRPGPNRATVRESLARALVTGGLLVARADGDVVGFVSFHLERQAYDRDCERGYVENIYVAPDHRGAGVGSALLTAAEDRLHERGADAVSLDVMAANDRARRFYRRHGYAPHRVELEKPADRENDTHTNH